MPLCLPSKSKPFLDFSATGKIVGMLLEVPNFREVSRRYLEDVVYFKSQVMLADQELRKPSP